MIWFLWLAFFGGEDVQRPRPPIEWGGKFLGQGPTPKQWVLPTGAVWQPQFILFGALRTDFSWFSANNGDVSALSTRLDLVGNLQLSGTERFVFSMRNLDEGGQFTRYVFSDPDGETGGRSEANAEVTSAFFEADLGEVFPALNQSDRRALDLGTAIGRMPLSFQDGMLINDNVDAVGLVRNNVLPKRLSNLRITAVWAWDGVNRGSQDDGKLWGLFSSMDTRTSSWDVDLVHTDVDDSSRWVGGVSATQRIGANNTTFRLMGENNEASSEGFLAFASWSRAPVGSHDHIYINGYKIWRGVVSAGRSPGAPGILAPVGIAFAGKGLGRAPSAISGGGEDSFGAACGRQWFFSHGKSQLVLEAAGRFASAKTEGISREQIALVGRYQTSLGHRNVIRFDAYLNRLDGEFGSGISSEWVLQL